MAPADAAANGRTPQHGRRPREPDPVFEALCEVAAIEAGQLTRAGRGAVNRATADLRAVDASPEEVRRRAALYRRQWPDIALTAPALAKHWAMLGRLVPSGAQRPGALGDRNTRTIGRVLDGIAPLGPVVTAVVTAIGIGSQEVPDDP